MLSFYSNIINNFKKYLFLLKQLINRDFKVKYKRSILGIFWSLLYPILMLIVMTIVFSNMFKLGKGVDNTNYIVYLMIGIVSFNFLSESTSLSLGSVVDNFPLINKIYIPKYIFPLSKVLFSSINFILTLIPLFIIIVLSKFGLGTYACYIGWKYIFIIYFIFFYLLFIIGISLIISCASVFLRDVVYIYGIVLTIWNYFTPVFYDISIIPANLLHIFKLNPMYHIITSIRKIILYGQIPSVSQFLIVGFIGIFTLLFGILIFKKNQDKFIYYI